MPVKGSQQMVFFFELKLLLLSRGDQARFPNKNLSEYIRLLKTVEGFRHGYNKDTVHMELQVVHSDENYTTILINRIDSTVPDPQAKNLDSGSVDGLDIDVDNGLFNSCHIIIKHGEDHLNAHSLVAENVNSLPFSLIEKFINRCLSEAIKIADPYIRRSNYRCLHEGKVKDGCAQYVPVFPKVELRGIPDDTLDEMLSKGLVSEVELINTYPSEGGIAEEGGFTRDREIIRLKVLQKGVSIKDNFFKMIGGKKSQYDKVRIKYKDQGFQRNPVYWTNDFDVVNNRALQKKTTIDLPEDAKTGYNEIHPIIAGRLKGLL